MLTLNEVMVCAPEIVLLLSACLMLLINAFSNDPKCRIVYYFAQLTLIVCGFVVIASYQGGEAVHAFSNSYINDGMATILKVAVAIIACFSFLYSYEFMEKYDQLRGEYFTLALFAILGMMILISAYSLLTVYLGLELLSLSLYAMIAMQKKSLPAIEAAMKFFILGALASGMLLYGMSMIYGVSGSLELGAISTHIQDGSDQLLLVFGLTFILVGIAFKLGAVPFHMWLPDVYQGASTSVVLFIASVPKLAAFAMAIRLLANGLQPLVNDWQSMLMLLSVLSITIGNIVAISQTNIKRMLAYSAIAHTGYLLLGISTGTESGYAASMFYIITYAIMSIGAFSMIVLLSRKDCEVDQLDQFKGLSDRAPWFSFMMLILMFSMAGIPPFLGFWGKWFVLKELIDAGFWKLAAVALFLSVIGAYYYLRLIKLMYFDKAESMTAISASKEMRLAVSANSLVLLILGLMPTSLLSICIGFMAMTI